MGIYALRVAPASAPTLVGPTIAGEGVNPVGSDYNNIDTNQFFDAPDATALTSFSAGDHIRVFVTATPAEYVEGEILNITSRNEVIFRVERQGTAIPAATLYGELSMREVTYGNAGTSSVLLGVAANHIGGFVQDIYADGHNNVSKEELRSLSISVGTAGTNVYHHDLPVRIGTFVPEGATITNTGSDDFVVYINS